MFSSVFLIFLAYFLGSLPFGLIIAKGIKGIDPRTAGSYSIGATNVSRLCGLGYGVATLVCDLFKGTLMVLIAQGLDKDPLVITLIALAAVLGHVFSCFLLFRGGKAVATTIGVFLPLAFLPLLASSFLCLLLIFLSGFVSLGSLTLVASLPLFLAFNANFEWVPLALILAGIVFFKHRENIRRLKDGTEKSWLKSRQPENQA
ncbi:MAG: glycerol-3-phosphate 1-O-acyltransferase PlsY [Desulfovibrionaceae bacterium]|nr:glycerol-3-phosphate 1-O-acyltransferase PlsY [Desulfovibrionaceae bacterium]